VVAQSGGTFDVASVPGHGTTFTLLFPPASEPSTADGAAADDGLPPRGTETVLLVEDDGAIRALAEQVLASCGYTVVTARSGVEALTAARTMRRIDVLLTDVVMPQLSGPQLVERILEKHPAPCVVYMTGWVDDSVTQLELDADVTLLRKPFTPLELARTVRAVLDSHASATPVPLGGVR
jgi:CheY-like chemotaxis protein